MIYTGNKTQKSLKKITTNQRLSNAAMFSTHQHQILQAGEGN